MLNNKRRTHTAVTVGLCAILAGTGAVATTVTGGGCSLALASTQTASGRDEIYFPDNNFRQALADALVYNLQKLNMPEYPITQDVVADITDLTPNGSGHSLRHQDIQCIYGLQAFKKLETIDLSQNKIKDINPVGDLTNLTILNLKYNRISDIRPVQNITGLTVLQVDSNQISDITPVQNLTSLTTFACKDNQIDDISSLKKLDKLRVLVLNNNKITSIDVVKDLKSLQFLLIADNKVTDISVIKDLTGLKSLAINNNPIENFAPIQNLNNLAFLNLSDTKFDDQDMSLITNKKNLAHLWLGKTNITKLDGIEKLTKLQTLFINDNKNITDFSNLKDLSNITTLDVSNTNFSDQDLQNLPNKERITELNIGGTKVTTLDGIDKFTNLKKLVISNNKNITDFSNLSKLTQLTSIDVSNTNFGDNDLKNIDTSKIEELMLGGTGITTLKSSKGQAYSNLQKIDVSNTKVSDFLPMQGCSKLTEIVLPNDGLTADRLRAAASAASASWINSPTLKLHTKSNEIDLSAFITETHSNYKYVPTLSSGTYEASTHKWRPENGQTIATFVFSYPEGDKTKYLNVVVDFGSQQTGAAGVDAQTQTDDSQSSELEKLLGAAESVKATENYTNADPDKQTAYTNAITAGKTVYDKLSSTPEQVKKAADAIKTALGNLNGDAKAKTALKDKLKALVDALATVQASNNYKNADQGLQTAYTEAVTKGQNTLGDANATSDDLRTATSNIETALGKLNGDNLSLKDKLKALVDALDTVKASDNYKGSDAGLQTAYTEAVTKGKTALKNTSATSEDFRTAVSNIEAALKNLNGDSKSKDALKKKLQDLVNAQETEKKLNNYSNADEKLQGEYTKAITAGQSTLNKTDASAEDYRKAAEAIQTALNGLNGDAKKIQDLSTALTTAKNTITDLNEKLTAAQQQAAADKAKIEELTKQLNTLKEQHAALQNQFNALTQENEANKKKIEEKEKTINELTTKTADLQKEIDALKKQIEALKKQPQCPSGGSGLGGAGFGGAGLGLIGDLDNLSNSSSSAALYRLYNPWTGEHLFSVDYGEVEKLCPLGWVFEGIAASVDLASGKPVYRLYNPWTGDHHYTTDLAEVTRNEKIGWKNEGIAFYSKGKVGVVSLYNPFAKSFYHHYTTDPAEVERMVKDGWKEEGVKWYCSLPANNKK